MSHNDGVPTPSSTAPSLSYLKLAAHTDRANLLAERLFDSTINQDLYDENIYSTSIASTNRQRPIPIILTMGGESLDTIEAVARRGFNMPDAALLVSRLYVVWSTETLRTMGEHPISGNAELLDNDNLEMVLETMKASLYVEQLLVDFAERFPTPAADLAALAESDYRYPVPFKEHSISHKGKEPESSSSLVRKPLDPLEAYAQSFEQGMNTNLYRVLYPAQTDTQLEEKRSNLSSGL